MRKLAAVAVVVAGVLLGVGPGPAAAYPGKDPPDPTEQLEDMAHALMAFVNGEWGRLVGVARADIAQFDLTETPPEEARESLEDILVEIEGLSFDLLTGANRQWNDKVEEVRSTHPAVAAEQSGAGPFPRTAADELHAALVFASYNFNASIEKSLARVTKAFAKAGLEMTHELRAPPTAHPALYKNGTMPVSPPLVGAFAFPDGHFKVITRDPAAGQAVGESFVVIHGPNSTREAALFLLSSQGDFAAGRSITLEASPLLPGSYVVRTGVLAGGQRVYNDTMGIRVPNGNPLTPPPPNRALSKASSLGGRKLMTATKRFGKNLVKQSKDTKKEAAKGDLTPEELALRQLAEFAESVRLIEEERQAALKAWLDGFHQFLALDPDAAELELAPGGGLSADELDAYQRSARQLFHSYTVKAAITYDGASETLELPLSFVVPEPGELPPLIFLRLFPEPLFRSPWAIFADTTAGGRISVVTDDPSAGQLSEDSALQVVDPETSEVVAERLLNRDADFPSGGPTVLDFSGVPEGTYIFRTLVLSNGVRVILSDEVITVPPPAEPEPPPPCTGTTGAILHDGKSIAVPPLDTFDAVFQGNSLQSLHVVFRNPAQPNTPFVDLNIVPATPIPLDSATGVEWITTFPPRTAGVYAFHYDPATFYFLSAASGTVTLRNFRDLLQPGGCAEVRVQGMTPAGKSIRLDFTLRTIDIGK